ncbi:MAG: cytochrome P450 [Actinomycetia bacterium]|nr:cytochrome P450 [Actinomycetes bacterium]MCH9701973.1 cytochrome P450 [Actinomycetes bacterium]MCH9762093.1 cytochrome P450 [Actinomycetes bacterium]
MTEATTDPVRLPPGPRIPKAATALVFFTARRKAVGAAAARYGDCFTVNLPIFGRTMIISDPALVRELFAASSDLVARASNLGTVLGPGSTFSLDGAEHRARRKLLLPPFHGKRMADYETIVAEEVSSETANWPEGREFSTLEPMMRITLNVILRAVFGAQGAALQELRRLLPPMVPLASLMVVLPTALRRDLGPWSPWGRVVRSRTRYNEIIAELIAEARSDPRFDDRTDVLALLMRASYEDGSAIADEHIADELLTLLAAGHETTATTLAWAIERLRRHPELLRRLTAEVDAGGTELLQATVWEVQRTRPVVEAMFRVAKTRIRLGEWVIPEGCGVMPSIALVHSSPCSFAEPQRFDPDRFLGGHPDSLTWIPFGGGVRRCLGAAFANMEMTVTLRELLREFTFATTNAPGERRRSRGIAIAPRLGGRAVVYRRS